MKSILLLSTVMLLSWMLPTWADPAPTVEEQPATTQATTLNTVEVGIEAPAQNEAERLNTLSTQINQSAGVTRQAEDGSPLSSLKQDLNLPPNLVIRGTSGGGLAIGTEY
ncbi:MAG TPA: hypothetical protein V6C65_25750 [Allocoleopsis sp.]